MGLQEFDHANEEPSWSLQLYLTIEMLLQWGSLDYHKQSLRNLQEASHRTRQLCAVILDTVGRELMIKREYTYDEEVCTLQNFCAVSRLVHHVRMFKMCNLADCPPHSHRDQKHGMDAYQEAYCLLQGWPVHTVPLEVKKGQEVVVTTDETAVASSSKLPITYPHFAHMCQPGDSLFVGRYLVNGADESSLYLEARPISLVTYQEAQRAVRAEVLF